MYVFIFILILIVFFLFIIEKPRVAEENKIKAIKCISNNGIPFSWEGYFYCLPKEQ